MSQSCQLYLFSRVCSSCCRFITLILPAGLSLVLQTLATFTRHSEQPTLRTIPSKILWHMIILLWKRFFILFVPAEVVFVSDLKCAEVRSSVTCTESNPDHITYLRGYMYLLMSCHFRQIVLSWYKTQPVSDLFPPLTGKEIHDPFAEVINNRVNFLKYCLGRLFEDLSCAFVDNFLLLLHYI